MNVLFIASKICLASLEIYPTLNNLCRSAMSNIKINYHNHRAIFRLTAVVGKEMSKHTVYPTTHFSAHENSLIACKFIFFKNQRQGCLAHNL